ncbi:DUF2069 domain-containing protein [Psychromonas sp. MME2]|uniref:DUF2069 domain-containing protein n=1 Tax=unclassified Psychromonas TaxID=2614957 RepID=UPI00339CEAA5
MKIEHYRLSAKIGYFGLLLLIPCWHLWLSPPTLNLSGWLVSAIWLIPLLFPLKGIIKGSPYTYAWSGFIALFYLMHGIVILISSETERILAGIELLLTLLFLIGGIYYAKYKGQELGLSIRKKKQ